jgi:hypothetical protein
MRVALAVLIVLVSLGFGAPPPANGAPTAELWYLCAHSSTIAAGTLRYPGGATAMLEVSETLKGSPAQRISVDVEAVDLRSGPHQTDLRDANGREVLVFLFATGASGRGAERRMFFAVDTPEALQIATATEIRMVRTEVARQARLVRTWRPHPAWPHHAEVAALIEKTLDRKTAQQAFKQLRELGPGAVPAMVDLMDDPRRFGADSISLPNPPGFWEASAIYEPELVVDAIATILDTIVGEDFGNIQNGGSEEQRALAVSGWRVYVVQERLAGAR